jgi:cellulose synthase/poly-beta-1,6-N-acetylglucosamine synthase-like glycosyltransferase
MKGWQFVYLPQFCAPAELPPEMIAFKQQAHRWTKGSFQTCLKLLPKVLKSRHLPLRVKTEAFFHLTNTLVYPLMVLLTLLMWPTFFYVLTPNPIRNSQYSRWIFSATLFVLATCSTSTFFVFGQRELFGKRAGWKSILYLPTLMALGVGISLNNCKAVFEALWGHIRRTPSEFVRTPKYGQTGLSRTTKWQPASVFTLKRMMLPIIEIAFGCYMVVCVFISIVWEFGRGTVPFLLIFAGGYFYVGFGSLYALYKMNQEQEEQLAAADAIVEPVST